MIDSSNSASIQTLLVKLSNPDAQTPEAKERGVAIENAAKVGVKQHKQTIAFLLEKAGQKAVDKQAKPAPTLETLAASDSMSFEEMKKSKDAQAKTDGSSTSTADGQVLAALLNAGSEGASTEELKKLKDAIIENEKPTTEPGETGSSPSENLKPMDPPKPPPPSEFPIGFDVNSLFNGSLESPSALLTKLSLQMAESLTQATQDKIKAQRELTDKTNELQREVIQDKTDEQIEQLEKADQASKAGSCISAIVSVAMILISAVVTVLTGGIGSAIMLGLTSVLFIADMSMKAAGMETTLTSMIMDPIMQNVVMPVINFFGGLVEDMLVAMGVDPNTASIVGSAMGALLTVAIVIASVVACKNIGPLKTAFSALGKGFSNMLSKMTPEFAKKAGSSIGGMLAKGQQNILSKMNFGGARTASTNAYNSAISSGLDVSTAQQRASVVMQNTLTQAIEKGGAAASIALQSVTGVGAVAGGGSSIASASFARDSQITQAQLEELMAAMLLSSEDLAKLAEKLREASLIAQDLMSAAFETQKGQVQTAKVIYDNIGRGV
ncbi:MAG: type III secretion system translocon subunit SctE [Vibrionaceae bacterium]